MDHFGYRAGELICEDVAVAAIAEREGTPAYVYSTQTFVDHFDRLRAAFAELNPIICYSIKSCHNLHILRLMRSLGASFDVVSGGELVRALEVGADASRIVFAGVGKTDDEIRMALGARVGWFNVESEQELERIDQLCELSNASTGAALRVNPDVDPHTHRYTTTGKRETKFGVDVDRARRVFREFGRDRRVRLTGIHLHIGSPVNRVEPYVEAVTRALQLVESLRVDGLTIDTLNIGGGFGAHYEGAEAPAAQAYAEAVIPVLRARGLQLILEPGRSISANAGILLARTIFTKRGGDKTFVIVDAAMTELIRPALYEAYHFAWPVKPANGMVPPHRGRDLKLDGTSLVDVVGPVCESADLLAPNRWLPPIQRGDLLAIFSTGAYGSVMGSRYNSRPLAPEILVDGGDYRVIRPRESYDQMLAAERS
ncbi:MAG: diaminopimelate decarboxylase [Phycisphaerales bacterium]|nr:diaminopimelate decarboxylase [Phycisphaerales bacterium]